MDLSLSVESALVGGSELMGMSIHWSKCFERVPQEIAFQLAERQGTHPRVLQLLRGMYRELRRRCVMAGHVGKALQPRAASSKLSSGCAFTQPSHEHPGQTRESQDPLQNRSLSDDAESSAKIVKTSMLLSKITGCFARVTPQKLNVYTTKAWGTTATALQSARAFLVNCEHLDVGSIIKSLGIQLMCANGMSNDVAEDWGRKGITVSRRIRWSSPLSLQTEASLIACLVGPAAMYGFSAGWLHSQPDQYDMNGSGCSSVGTKRRSRCREIAAEQRPEAFAELDRVSHCHANGGSMCGGPVTVTHNILCWMGWHWQAPGLFAKCGTITPGTAG